LRTYGRLAYWPVPLFHGAASGAGSGYAFPPAADQLAGALLLALLGAEHDEGAGKDRAIHCRICSRCWAWATSSGVEGERIDPGIRAATLPCVPLLLAAWRGDEPAAAGLTEVMVRAAAARGEGAALTSAEYATAVLCNGVGNYGLAAEAAYSASAIDRLVISP
jgi:hypothetical protein